MECAHLRIGKEYLQSVAWPDALRQSAYDQCYCSWCYSSEFPDTLTVANYTYVIPRGWTRFAVSVDEGFARHHNIWDTWLNCYHGTSIESAKSAVEHRQLLLPSDVTLEGRKIAIREGHIPGEQYVFTTPSIAYAALGCYATTYDFISPSDRKPYTIKVALQCRQKPSSIIVQPETVRAREQQIRICSYIPNEALEWKTQHRSSVMIYGLLLEVNSLHGMVSGPMPIPRYSPPLFEPSIDIEWSPVVTPRTFKAPMARQSMTKKKIAVLVLLICLTFVPLGALVIGQIYKGDCPIQPWIPRWLFIFGAAGLGSFGLIFFITLITFKCCSEKPKRGHYTSGFIGCLLALFFLGWLITGSVWVFPHKTKVQFSEPTADNYCQEIAYMSTFGLLLAQYALVGLVICIGGVTVCCDAM